VVDDERRGAAGQAPDEEAAARPVAVALAATAELVPDERAAERQRDAKAEIEARLSVVAVHEVDDGAAEEIATFGERGRLRGDAEPDGPGVDEEDLPAIPFAIGVGGQGSEHEEQEDGQLSHGGRKSSPRARVQLRRIT